MAAAYEGISSTHNIVGLPSNGYLQERYPSEIGHSLQLFADGMRDILGPSQYPQARILVDPLPAHTRNGSLYFYTLWGNGVEAPYIPPSDKRAEYYGLSARKAERVRNEKRSKRPYEHIQLDAEGFVGRISLREGIGSLAVASADARGKVYRSEVGSIDEITAETVAIDALSVAVAIGPTRFHSAVYWWPRNGHAFLRKFEDDNSRAVLDGLYSK